MAHCSGGTKAIILGFLLLTLLLPTSSSSHNGAMAIAVPIEGITVDGDFSDWPEGMREYPIALPESGVESVNEEDFEGAFRIGFSEQENALYVAVEVKDESILGEHRGDWNTQDGCEIYVDVGHGKEDEPVTQYAIRGGNRIASTLAGGRQWENVEVEVQRGEDIHQYEWRIDIGEISKGEIELHPQVLLGIDVVVCDRDEDSSFSWMAWGPESFKFTSDRVGLAVP
jgi:hypothetical protein